MAESKRLDKSWVGSVSSGTMREEDLIPAFETVLDAAGVPYERPEAVNRLLAGEALGDDDWAAVGWYLNEELLDALNDVAPEGCYFGSHPGDGADYGFWSMDEDEDEDE